jgi:hypothetical protein
MFTSTKRGVKALMEKRMMHLYGRTIKTVVFGERSHIVWSQWYEFGKPHFRYVADHNNKTLDELNVERWFGELTNKRIWRESWESIKQLLEAIQSFIESWNQSGRAFTWTKPAYKILTSLAKAKQAYNIV